MMKRSIVIVVASLLWVTGPVQAEEKGSAAGSAPGSAAGSEAGSHAGTGSGSGSGSGAGSGTQALVPGETEATGKGELHTINAAAGQVNITHEPMPELGWPTMTMDLPVTKKVELSAFKPGDKVTFTLKLGRDQVYRITGMAKAE